MAAAAAAGVQRLAAVSDEQLQSDDVAYMARHKLDALFSDLLAALLKQKPRDPLQYVIDALALGPQHAQQVRNVAGRVVELVGADQTQTHVCRHARLSAGVH